VTTAAKPTELSAPELRIASPGDSEFAFAARKVAFASYAESAGAWCESEERRLHERRFNLREFRIISVSGVDVGVIAVRIEPVAFYLRIGFSAAGETDTGCEGGANS
jgi:hypothetical protein